MLARSSFSTNEKKLYVDRKVGGFFIFSTAGSNRGIHSAGLFPRKCTAACQPQTAATDSDITSSFPGETRPCVAGANSGARFTRGVVEGGGLGGALTAERMRPVSLACRLF